MMFDWDLWPASVDRAWVDAQSAKRFAEMNGRVLEVVRAMNAALSTAQELNEYLSAALKHQPAARSTARK